MDEPGLAQLPALELEDDELLCVQPLLLVRPDDVDEGDRPGVVGENIPEREAQTASGLARDLAPGDLISSLHIYTDPDFTSSHIEKVDQLHRG